jgi:glucokinase
MAHQSSAVGIDLGGTKTIVAIVNASGKILQTTRLTTPASEGSQAVIEKIAKAVCELIDGAGLSPAGLGVGVAGQIAPSGELVQYAPNLDWHDVPLQAALQEQTGLPAVLLNDVRAATWAEWLFGAGYGCDDLVCLFVGTGIGGGVVSGGRMLAGCTNTAGELGHITTDLNGPDCTCGHRGCLEALAGGWAIARRARQAIRDNPAAGQAFCQAAGLNEPVAPEDISAAAVAAAARAYDPLARTLVDEVARALIAGTVSLVNAFNPCRLLLGGGVMTGLPELTGRIEAGIRAAALNAASEGLEVLAARLKGDAGVVGAATLAIQSFAP